MWDRGDLLHTSFADTQPIASSEPFSPTLAPTDRDTQIPGSVVMSLLSRNEHQVDRIVRVLAGLGLISLVFVGPQTPWGWGGAVLVATGLIGWCPIYATLGLSTYRTAKN